MNFSALLKSSREAKGLTQKQMAELLNMTERAYQSYELKEREPRLEKLARIAVLLEVSVDYLLGLSDVKERR